MKTKFFEDVCIYFRMNMHFQKQHARWCLFPAKQLLMQFDLVGYWQSALAAGRIFPREITAFHAPSRSRLPCCRSLNFFFSSIFNFFDVYYR